MTEILMAKRVYLPSDPGSLHTLQSNSAHERLIGNHPGKVTTFTVKLFRSPTALSFLEMLVKLTERLGLDSESWNVNWGYSGNQPVMAMIELSDRVITFNSKGWESKFPNVLAISTIEASCVKLVSEVLVEAGYSLNSEHEEDGKVPVSFSMASTDGVMTSFRKFDALPLDTIVGNYQPKVIDDTRKLLKVMAADRNGVAIINGPPGVGKSYLIRAILSELKDVRYPLVCTPPQHFLTNMGDFTEALISSRPFAVETNDVTAPTVVVLEDVGDLLAADNVTHHTNETSNLLNLADGLLGLLVNTIFVLTFNHEVTKINPALLRPGRCLGHIQVGPLDRDQAAGLTGLDLPPGKFTLGEVYEMKRTGALLEMFSHPEETGFRRRR
jgi:predicted AAA+ superfamily ATPase